MRNKKQGMAFPPTEAETETIVRHEDGRRARQATFNSIIRPVITNVLACGVAGVVVGLIEGEGMSRGRGPCGIPAVSYDITAA